MRALVTIAAIGGALLAGAAVWCVLPSSRAALAPSLSPAAIVPAPEPVAATAACAPIAAPSTACSDVDERTVLLPDGSRVEALNGARGAKPLGDAWPVDVPWSPIVTVEHSPAGVDWWVHVDGSRSTTEMKWRADLNRFDAVTRLARPTPTAAVPAPTTK